MLVTAGFLRDGMLMQACKKIETELGFAQWLDIKKEA